MGQQFSYNVKLIPLDIVNSEQRAFRDSLNAVPYLLYEVEQLNDGNKIVINKPGGKRNFGRLSRNDFMVFIYDFQNETLWLISHSEILEDLKSKYLVDRAETKKIIKGMYKVCTGLEPDDVIIQNNISDLEGLTSETIYKVYKWIWGQEDCNYPTKKGRWLSMDAILEEFAMTKDEIEGCDV